MQLMPLLEPGLWLVEAVVVWSEVGHLSGMARQLPWAQTDPP